MRRVNSPNISSNFDAARTLSKQTVIMGINNIFTAGKPYSTNTDRAFVLISTPTRKKRLLSLFSMRHS